MRSKYGMVTKFFPAQMYDPEQVFESLVWCAESQQKLSRPTQSQTVGCVTHNFWNTSETFLQNRVPKILFYTPNWLTLSGPRKFLWHSAHQTKLSNTCLGSYICAGKNFVTIPCLERILSYQTCKHSEFWDFIPLSNPILKESLWSVPKIVFYAPNCLTLNEPRKFFMRFRTSN